MKNAITIAFREYGENIRTKGFWISILIVPIILSISLVVPKVLSEKAIPTRNFVLVDPDKVLESQIRTAVEEDYRNQIAKSLKDYLKKNAAPESMESALKAANTWQFQSTNSVESFDVSSFVPNPKEEFKPPKARYQLVSLPDNLAAETQNEKILQFLKPYLEGEKYPIGDSRDVKLFAGIFISKSTDPQSGSLPQIQYWSSNPSEDALREMVSRTANVEARRAAMDKLGLDQSVVEETMRIHVPIQEFDARKAEGKEQVQLSDKIKQWAPSAFVYLLFISLMSVMQMLLNSTIEEKSNRLLEILLSSVRPVEIMIGKLLGNGLAGLTLVAAWISILAGFAYYQMDQNSEFATGVSQALGSSNLLPAFFIYFVLGFLIYSGMFLAIGSISQTVKDAQSYSGFLMIFMIVPLITMMYIPRDPNGVVATTLSWIPTLTPFVMLNRLSGHPPMFEIVGSFILCCITIVVIFYFSAKIFKKSIISSGGGSHGKVKKQNS